MDNPPEIVTQILGYLEQGQEIALGWLMSPAAWSQLGLLVASWIIAVLVSRRLGPRIVAFIAPKEDARGLIAAARRFALRFLPLLLPFLAYGFTAIGEAFTRSVFGSGAVIAFGKRLFLFIAARRFARDILRDGFLRFLGRYVLIPIAGLYALGLLPTVTEWLESLTVELGNIRFTVMALLRGIVAGSLLFWLGRW